MEKKKDYYDILNKNIKAISLDIFDTLLLRNKKPEIQRFYEISCIHSKLFKIKGYNISSKEAFFSRQLSNRILYDSARFDGEVKINSIYILMLKLLGIDNNTIIKDMLKEEIFYEIKNITFNNKLYERIIYLIKDKQFRLYILSDMYLNHESIRFLLKNFINDLKIKKIYVSSDNQAKKIDGKLFEKFLKEEKLLPNEVLHIGNDYLADFIQPKKRGINVFFVPRKRSFEFQKKIYEKLFLIKYNKIVL